MELEGKQKGCNHPERPELKTCYHCGEGLCYECSLKYYIGSEVVSWETFFGSKQYKFEYGDFCPYCYLEKLYRDNPENTRKKPKFLIRFGIGTLIPLVFFIVLAILTHWTLFLIFLPVELIIVVPSTVVPYKRKRRAYRNFKNNEEQALRLLS